MSVQLRVGGKGLKADAIGIGGLLLGVPLMVLCAVKFREFFSRTTEVAPAGLLDAPARHAADHI